MLEWLMFWRFSTSDRIVEPFYFVVWTVPYLAPNSYLGLHLHIVASVQYPNISELFLLQHDLQSTVSSNLLIDLYRVVSPARTKRPRPR